MRVCIVLHTDLLHPWPVLRPMREIEVLRAAGREVHVVSWIKDPSAPWPEHEAQDGLEIHRVKLAPPRGRWKRGSGYRAVMERFAREIISVRPEALPVILAALRALSPSIKLHVVGGLPERVASARETVSRFGLQDRVSFTGPLQTPAYLEETALLDAGLAIFYPTSANQRFVVPLKLFDYMGLGVPAVVSDFPEMRRIAVETCRFGVAIPPKDPHAIGQAISNLA